MNCVNEAAVASLKSKIEDLETEQELLADKILCIGKKYKELACAVWQCPEDELDEHRHSDTLKEANAQAIKLAQLKGGTL